MARRNPRGVQWVVIASENRQIWPVAPVRVVTRDEALHNQTRRDVRQVVIRGFNTRDEAEAYADAMRTTNVEISRASDGTIVYRGPLLEVGESAHKLDLRGVDRGRLFGILEAPEVQLAKGKKALIVRRTDAANRPANPIKGMPGGSVSGCIEKQKRKPKSKRPSDPGAYCAAIADRIEPGWRSKKNAESNADIVARAKNELQTAYGHLEQAREHKARRPSSGQAYVGHVQSAAQWFQNAMRTAEQATGRQARTIERDANAEIDELMLEFPGVHLSLRQSNAGAKMPTKRARDTYIEIEADRDAKGITVGDARLAMEGMPDRALIIIGIDDDKFNTAGGIHVPAQHISGEKGGREPFLQFSEWVDIAEEAGTSRGNPGRKGAKKRKRNTHDADRSTRQFEAALKRAEQDLGYAAEQLGQGHMTTSAEALLSTTYWLGRAASEIDYARPSEVTAERQARLRSLEQDMRTWGKTLIEHSQATF